MTPERATIEEDARKAYLELGSEGLDEDVVYIAGYVQGHATASEKAVTLDQLAAAVEAARHAMYAVNIEMPYLARITYFTDPEGNVDLDGLRAADVDAERRNDAAVRAVVLAAFTAIGIKVAYEEQP